LGLALSAGKLTANAGRLLRVGGGTSLPGLVARRIDPGILRKVVGASAARKIVVTGSNGKTTTCRMIAALAHAAGRRITQYRAGSNLVQGVTGSCGRSTGFRSGHARRCRRPGSASF
jgi:lipid II isoglutaminyl synthase (glutamine-hydrolysing)